MGINIWDKIRIMETNFFATWITEKKKKVDRGKLLNIHHVLLLVTLITVSSLHFCSSPALVPLSFFSDSRLCYVCVCFIVCNQYFFSCLFINLLSCNFVRVTNKRSYLRNISVDKDKSLLYISVGVRNPNTPLFILKSESYPINYLTK